MEALFRLQIQLYCIKIQLSKLHANTLAIAWLDHMEATSVSRQLSATFQQSALTFQGNVPQTFDFHLLVTLSFV